MKITNEMKKKITLRLANDPDSRVRADAYSSPLMPKEKLSKMARNPKADKEEKIAVASNPNTPPEDLDRLADDNTTWGVKEAVAKNPSVWQKTLEKLAKDKHYSVRCAVISNPNVTPEIIIALSNDSNLWVKKVLLQAIMRDAKVE